MSDFANFFIDNNSYIVLTLVFISLALLIMVVSLLASHMKLLGRVQRFMGKRSEKHNIEAMLLEYLDEVKAVHMEQADIVKHMQNIDKKMKLCVQNVGMIRYNAFADMGGDLCFALALLDDNHNGVVISTIYGRESAYTYGKPVIKGESKYSLSDEEIEAIDIAIHPKS